MMNFQIRWRYLGIGIISAAAVAGVIVLVHEFQMPRIVERVLNESRELAEAGETERARARYADYLTLDPGNSEAYEEYADLVMAGSSDVGSTRNDATALKLLDSAVQSGSTNDKTKIRLIQSAMRLKKYSIARRMLQRLDLKTLNNAELYAADGICDLNGGRPDRAEKNFERALAIDSKCEEAWTGLLEIQADVNSDLKAAELTADKMIDVLPAKGQAAKAWLFVRTEDFDAAGEAFLKAAQLLPGEQEQAFELANFVMRSGVSTDGENRSMVEFAYDNLKTACESNVNYDVAFMLGDLSQRLERYEDAEGHYRKCLSFRSSDPPAIGRIVEVLSASESFQKATDSLDGLPDTKSMITLKAVLKSKLLYDQGKYEEASDTLEGVIEIAESEMRQAAHVLLIDCFSKQNRHADAIEVGHKLLAVSANHDESRKLLIQSMINDNRYADAINQMQMVFSPELYYDDLLSYLIDHAERLGLEDKLAVDMQAAEKFGQEASLPRIYNALQEIRNGRFADAEQMLVKWAVNTPGAKEYWAQVVIEREREFEKYARNGFNGFEALADDHARKMACQAAIRNGDAVQAASWLNEFIDTQLASNESLELAASVILATHETNRLAAVELLNLLYPKFYKRLREPTGKVTEIVAEVVNRLHDDRLVGLEEYLVIKESSVQLIALLSRKVADKKIDGNKLSRSLGSQNDTPKAIQQSLPLIFETEAAVSEADLSELVDELQEYVVAEGKTQPIVSSMLRLSGYDESIRPSFADYGIWIKKQRKDDDYALYLYASGLRASRQFPESLACLREAFAINQNPLYLLHASYSLWLMHRSEQARETLELALNIGLQPESLHLLDQKLLEKLLKDPEFQDVGLTAR